MADTDSFSPQGHILNQRDLAIRFVRPEVYRLNNTELVHTSVNNYLDNQLFGGFDRHRMAKLKSRSVYSYNANLEDYEMEDYLLCEWNLAQTFGRVVHDIIDRVLDRKYGKVNGEQEKDDKGIVVKNEIKDEIDDAASVWDVAIVKIEVSTKHKIKEEDVKHEPEPGPSSEGAPKRKIDGDDSQACKLAKLEIIIKQEKIEPEDEEVKIEPDAMGQIIIKQEPINENRDTLSGNNYNHSEVINEIIANYYNDATIAQLIENSAEPDIDDNILEQFVEDNTVGGFVNRLINTEPIIKELLEVISPFRLCATNYMIWDEDFNGSGRSIAGTIDCLLWHSYEKREVIVIDWTTKGNMSYPLDVKIRSSPFYRHDRNLTKLKRIFCQLHLYSYILEKRYNVKVVGIWVAQINYKLSIHKGSSYKACKCTKLN